jgi:hypothetical protein
LTTVQPAVSAGRARAWAEGIGAAIPVWGWLCVICVASAAVRFGLALSVHGPWVFQDEMVYSDLARSLGQTGHFAIRQAPGTNGFGPGYPALIAPAYALFSSPEKAYVVVRLINALVMSLAAIPTYVIARWLMRPSLALVAAALAVAIPSMMYTTTVMSENAFYPASTAAAAALFLTLERPTVLRQVAIFAFLLIAFSVRAQGVIIVAALPVAILLVALANAWSECRLRPRKLVDELWRFRISWLVLAGGGLALLAYEKALGHSLTSVLGVYGGVTKMQHPFGSTLRWLVFHIAELDLSLAVIPFAALIVIVVLGLRPGEPSAALRAFSATSLCLVGVFVLTASVYAADPTGERIEERYMFHVAPLFMIALLAWIDRGLPRPRISTGIAAAVAATLPATIPYTQLISPNVLHSAVGLVPLQVIEERGTLNPNDGTIAVALVALAAVALILSVPPRYALLLPLVVFLYYGVFELRPIHRRIVAASRDARNAGLHAQPGWVDRRVRGDANVALVVYGGETALPFWQNEFFNRTVNTVYTLSGPYDGLPRTDLTPDSSGLLHDAAGNPVQRRYILANYQVVPAGQELAADRDIGMYLYRSSEPLRIVETNLGVHPDHWSGPAVFWNRYRCHGGVLRATVQSDPAILRNATQTLTAYEGMDTTKPIAHTKARAGQVTTFTVPLRSRGGTCSTTIGITPTAVPAQVTPSGDTRELGTRFLRFDYEPPQG